MMNVRILMYLLLFLQLLMTMMMTMNSLDNQTNIQRRNSENFKNMHSQLRVFVNMRILIKSFNMVY